MRSIVFEFETENGVFRDALTFEDDATPSNEEIEAMKQERLNNWLYIIKNPPVVETKKLSLEDIPADAPPELVAAIKTFIEG